MSEAPVEQRVELDRKLIAAVDRLGRALRLARQDIATTLELSVLQLHLLEHLESRGPRRVGHLARELDVTQPTISDALAALEVKNYVYRSPDPADARATVVSLATEGLTAVATLRTRLGTVLEGHRPVSDADAATALFVLLEEVRRLQALGVISVNRSCLSCAHYRAGDAEKPARCQLLACDLQRIDLRVDCPDHQVPAGSKP